MSRKENSAPAGGHELSTFSGIRIITRSQKLSLRFTGLTAYQKYGGWEEDICRSRQENGWAPSNEQEYILPVSKFLKLWLLESFVARLKSGPRLTTKSTMKATNVQLSARLTNRRLFPGAGPPRPAAYPKLLIERSGRRCWYTFFRSLRAVLSGVLDSCAYDQISLGREVSVAFTSQGPVVYRFGRNSAVDPVSATRETNRTARFPKKS